MTQEGPNTISGPFGAADKILEMPADHVAAMYRVKCGVDVRGHLGPRDTLHLYRCRTTDVEFWRPEDLAGSEEFYQALAANWPEYYRDWRWEYGVVSRYLDRKDRVLEVGCGRGYFLRFAEARVHDGVGVEFNREAIANKVTKWPILATTVEALAEETGPSFGLVCSFQVLEHVVDPAGFLSACLRATKPGGLVAVSVPNHENAVATARQDAFDLPPHHVNHFTPESMRKIAARYDVDLVRIHLQPREFRFDLVAPRTRKALPYRLARKAAGWVFRGIYAALSEPGPTMLAVYRKRS
jgi:SAM-dependent methyltransferase